MVTSTPTRTGSETLYRLLDEELDFSPSFHRIYSSHLAMALVALEQLGAPPSRLQAVFDAHAHGGEAERREDWDLLQVRLEEVHDLGIDATVRRRVPDLVDAVGTALFHPVIRLAYGLDVGHEGQVAAALLDWERRAERYVTGPTGDGTRRLADVAAALSSHPVGTWKRTFDLDGISRRPELTAALGGVLLDDATLDDVSAFALAAHATADDFLTLHLVTGARAVRAVANVVDEDTARRLAAATVPVMAIAYAAVGAPRLLDGDHLDELRRHPLPAGEAIAARAVVARDPHMIKLANVALVEAARTGDPLYRFLAARVVGLTDPTR
ncbi:MAG: questin oxidase family protein [Actinomycetota bacterium]|nr:questin oxidase family protein [Actinomycetota bacterium]